MSNLMYSSIVRTYNRPRSFRHFILLIRCIKIIFVIYSSIYSLAGEFFFFFFFFYRSLFSDTISSSVPKCTHFGAIINIRGAYDKFPDFFRMDI